MATENMITIKNLPEQFKSTKVQDQNFKIRTLKEIEKEEIEKAIKKYGMDKIGMKEITESLGVSRATIYRKIREYKIET
jgi:transcriptional regulator of acetoin/glycerol metabolism